MMECANNKLVCLVIAYWEGIQAFQVYDVRGLQLVATFIKNSIGGTLLVACVKDGNNNIMVIPIHAIVSTKNEDSWCWFLQHIRANINILPAFIIFYRDKGLVETVTRKYETVPHFFCFCHLMENLNTRFRNRDLKKKAWGMKKRFNKISHLQVRNSIYVLGEQPSRG